MHAKGYLFENSLVYKYGEESTMDGKITEKTIDTAEVVKFQNISMKQLTLIIKTWREFFHHTYCFLLAFRP